MPRFSTKSRAHLRTCTPGIQQVFNKVIEKFNCTILEGSRGEVRQNGLFHDGLSRKQYPDSKHNVIPSEGIDAAPWPIDWKDRERFTYFAGYVKGIADSLGIKIRWGGDWDMDTEVDDNTFDDLCHFEEIK